MNSPPTSPEYSIYYLQQQVETRTESCTTIQNSSIYDLHQYQQAECRTISTITPNSSISTLYHQNPADRTKTTTNTTTTSTALDSNELIPLTPTNSSTLNSSETIPLSPTTTTTTHTSLNSIGFIPIPPTTTTTTSASFSSSSLETLADADPPLSPPTSSTPPPPLTPNSPPARQLNPADIRLHLETIDRTALPPAYPSRSRIEAAEILLEIRYGRRERSREGTVELELELERSSSRPLVVVQADDRICGESAAKEGSRGGAMWGSRLRAKTKKSVKLAG